MSLKVGELFVNLGIKGSEKTIGAVAGATKGMGDLKSMSLEAKAAIAGAIYLLQDLMMDSARMGSSLKNFNSLTGMSTQNLQQWQYAARQAGVSADEMTGSLKAVQNSMTNMLLGKGAPEGLAMLANKVGFDPAKARDTLYVMQQLQKFAQQIPQDVGNPLLKSFGVSEGTIAAMRRNAFRPDVFAKAPTYSDREVGELNKVDAAWANLGNQIQMAMGHFTARHGNQMVNDLSKVTREVLALAEALTVLGNKVKVFETLSKATAGIANTFKLVNEVIDKIGGKESQKGDLLYTAPGQEAVPGFNSSPAGKFFKSLFGSSGVGAAAKDTLNGIPLPADGRGGAQTIEVTQTLQFQHDGKDAKKTAGSVHKAVKDAFRQLQSQAQGS